jgi:hypothetical protein
VYQNYGTVKFYYDEVNARFTSFTHHSSTQPSDWDSTIIHYNANAVPVNYLEIYPSVSGGLHCNGNILTFDSHGKVLKKYSKNDIAMSDFTNSYLTDVSDRSAIRLYDSLVYDIYNRVESVHRIFDNPSYSTPYYPSYIKFIYPAASDSLFSKIEFHDRESSLAPFRLRETESFLAFDNQKNPFFEDFRWYGLLTPTLTQFHIIPDPHSSFSTFYLTAFPSNCTSLKIVDAVTPTNIADHLSYTYNSQNLPVSVTSDLSNTNGLTFHYKKYRKY